MTLYLQKKEKNTISTNLQHDAHLQERK